MLGDKSDVRVSELERLFYNCDYHAALKIEADRHHPAMWLCLTNLTRTFFSQAL